MSKNDTIGAVVCAMAGMNPKFVGLMRDTANRLNGADASGWSARLTEVYQQGLPKPLQPASPPLFVPMPDLDAQPFPGSSAFLFDEFFTTEPAFGTKKVFSFIGQNVQMWFGGMRALPTQPSQLTLDRLARGEYDPAIVSEIGEAHCDLQLGEVRWLFESGLLVEGRWYACYTRDKNGVRRALYYGGGWFVEAVEVPNAIGWSVGCEFVSRKRLVAQA